MEAPFYKTIWFWFIVVGILLSALSTLLYIMDMASTTIVYSLGALGVLSIFAGTLTSILRERGKRRDGKQGKIKGEISDQKLLELASRATATHPQDLQKAIEREAYQAKYGGIQAAKGGSNPEPTSQDVR